MRQLTEAEKEAQLIDWVACPDMSPEYSDYEIHRDGFTAGLDHSSEQIAALTAERNSLQEQLFKATKDLKRMARDWRSYAAGDYCQTYNTGMADGLTRTADQLEDYVNDAWRALEESADEQKQEIRH